MKIDIAERLSSWGVSQIDPGKSLNLIERYIDSFVDTNSAYYKNTYSQNVQGVYLWDTLKADYKLCKLQGISFKDVSKSVYFFWEDVVPCLRYDLDIAHIYNSEIATLLKHIPSLPSDLYIFDDTYSWTFIRTHFEFNEIGDNCKIVDPLKIIA
ncbi:hypothetical protein QFZ77_007546 [Paenibacillus sp. V4I3]|uniref:hypothetical protein n=1 Tax=Paenibacillus sp. V4I3 TaxID=3042305 RepID=UPI002782E27E|nr:hypothetical protein [Paenibacillus sp. V4I3]MDQ0878887.1 hypothetical protein [Paenibacillus sp. V4I3]